MTIDNFRCGNMEITVNYYHARRLNDAIDIDRTVTTYHTESFQFIDMTKMVTFFVTATSEVHKLNFFCSICDKYGVCTWMKFASDMFGCFYGCSYTQEHTLFTI